jgi:hypothetical protein
MRRAARWVEQNHTLQYMRRRFSVTAAAGATEIEIPSTGIKTILNFRWTTSGTATGWFNCNKVSFGDIDWDRSAVLGLPGQFYLDGERTLVFNGTVQAEAKAEGMLVRYSDWPKTDSEEHWLLNNAESLLLVRSMIELAVVNTRDERTWTMFRTHQEDAIRTLMNADYEAQYSGQDISLRA